MGSVEGCAQGETVKEYTMLAFASVLVTIWLDRFLRTHILRRRIFWIFLGVMFFFKMLVNGYLTWRPIVVYGEPFYLGIRLGTIPVEDFVYGFSLVALSIIFWEHQMNKGRTR
jgi:lycopene cyclase domain-containing protein